MALAISGFSRVRRSSSRIRSNQLPARWASSPCSATRSSTFQLRSPASTSRCASSARGLRGLEVGGEERVACRAPGGCRRRRRRRRCSSPSSAAAAVSRSPDITRAAGEPDAQPCGRLGVGAVERLAVRRRGHRVADRVEQVAAQRQTRSPDAAPVACGRTASTSASASRYAPTAASVSAARSRYGTASADAPDCEQVVTDPRRRRVQLDRAGSAASRWIRRRRCGGTSSRRRVAHEPVAESVAGARRARRCNAASARRGGRTPRLSGSPESATNSSVSNDDPTTATRCSTSRVAGAMPPIMLASSACTHSRLVGRPPGELVDGERDAAAERGDLARSSSARGSGDVAAHERRRCRRRASGPSSSSIAPWRSIRLWRVSASVSRRRRRPMGEHDADALVARRAGDVVQEAQAGVVGVVDVVDGQQQPVRGRREADQLGGGDEQPLVRALARPRDLGAGERAVDLLAVVVGETVEQRRVAPAHVGERLDDRARTATRPRPAPTCRARRGSPAPRASAVDRGEQRRLADAGRAADDQHVRLRPAAESTSARSASASSPSRPTSVSSRRAHVVLGEQAVAQRHRLAPGGDAELAAQRAVHALELAERGVAVAVRGVAAHEREVGELVAGSRSTTVSQRPSRRSRSRWRSRSCSRRSSAHSS